MKTIKNKFAVWAAIAASTFALAACSGGGGNSEVPQQQAKPAAAAKAKSSEKKVIVGVDEKFPPMAFRGEDGTFQGYDIDLAKEAFRRMGVDYEFVPIEWGRKEELLNDEKVIDMIWSGLNISEERKLLYNYSEPYISNLQVVITTASSQMRSLQDLGGKVVGVQEGSSLMPKLQDFDGPNGRIKDIIGYPDYVSILNKVQLGQIQAGAMGGVVANYFIITQPGKFKVLEGNFGETQMGVAMRKEDVVLAGQLNSALQEMKADGAAKRIYDKWFTSKQPRKPPQGGFFM